MTGGDLFFVAVGVAAIWFIRRSWRWKQDLDAARVITRDPALFRASQEDTRHELYSSLKGPAAKGFNGHHRDRRAHVLAMQARRRL
jgi:hypothetical protein